MLFLLAGALAAEAWAEIESGGDVSIMAINMKQDHRTLNTYYDNFGDGWGWRRGGSGVSFGTSTTTEEPCEVGTLVVDLFDTRTKKLIWRGSASDTLSHTSDKNIKKLNMYVQNILTTSLLKPAKDSYKTELIRETQHVGTNQ